MNEHKGILGYDINDILNMKLELPKDKSKLNKDVVIIESAFYDEGADRCF